MAKIDGTTIDDDDDLDLVMPKYNLIEYSSNYSETKGSLWFHSKVKTTNFNADIANTNNFKFFKYNAKLLGGTVAQSAPNQANGILKNATIAVPFKYISNFWRSLGIPLINFKIGLKLKWKNYCVLSANGSDNVNDDDNGNNITFFYQRHKSICSGCNFISRRQSKIIKIS